MSGEGLHVRPDLVIPDRELNESTSRSGGPGGQHVNKTETRVTLRWNIPASQALSERQRRLLLDRLGPRLSKAGDLILHADGSRSQADNKGEARNRLAEIVRSALHVAKKRKATRPSRGSKERRLKAKRKQSNNKRLRQRVRDEH